MKKLRPLSLVSIIILTVGHIFAPVAAAHPLGNFTINHYLGFHIQPETITLDYVLDMAEIPAFQEISTFDTNQNGHIDTNEAAGYHPGKCNAIRADLDFQINGRPVTLNVVSSAIEFPPGAGGLPTLRLTCTFRTSIALTAESMLVEFKNKVYASRLGWREIVVTGEGISIQGDLPVMTESISQRLTTYPDDLLTNPLDQRQVSFEFVPVEDPGPVLSKAEGSAADRGVVFGQQISQPDVAQPDQPTIDRNDTFTRLIMQQELSPLLLLVVLAISFGWGAAHAFTPGHGKTIVAAYLVGSRGTTRHAFFLGLTTTLTHTAGVFVLGFITLFASEFVLPEQLYPWLEVVSGILVVMIGLSLFRGRLHQFVSSKDNSHHHGHHSQDHHIHHSHSPDHDHDHSHLLPGADGSPVTWRSLLALGISGGLIPCPSALVVMLSAISLQRIGFGLVLIVAFSLGLASILTSIGLLWVHSGRLLGRIISIPTNGYLFRVLPAISALFITIIGAGITLRALMQTGLLWI
jgi:ABC-type nickel/cobalt efflux system permease component RcnA